MEKDRQDLLMYQDEIKEILSSMDYNDSIEMNTTEETEQSVQGKYGKGKAIELSGLANSEKIIKEENILEILRIIIGACLSEISKTKLTSITNQ